MTHLGARLFFAVFLQTLASGCFLFHGDDAPDDDPPDTSVPDTPTPPDAAHADTGIPTADAGPVTPLPRSCLPMNVRASRCIDCDELPRYYWNGSYCDQIGCDCVGDDCDTTFDTIHDCVDAMSPCVEELCESTGGRFTIGCNDAVCGVTEDAPCLFAGPVCDCGPNANFMGTYGCVPDPVCGVARDDATLCEATGGTFDASCCPTECGVPCGDPCRALACRCSDLEVFDPRLGCVTAARCGAIGTSCEGSHECPAETYCSGGTCIELSCEP